MVVIELAWDRMEICVDQSDGHDTFFELAELVGVGGPVRLRSADQLVP
ncbi:hypothetical protein [Rhodococcus sp. IEGM 1379]|nr:hypothetical protein [Rhodococcus sp. IEGM 1379]MDI9914079.1 hypothetical protein [Rhodococcus sp. IEGM 1379]